MRLSGMKAGLGPPLALLSLCLLAGCEWSASLVAGEPPAWPGTQAQVPVSGIGGRVAWQGQQAETQGRSFVVAETEEQWQGMWRKAGTEAPGPLPRGWVGFGVFAGVRDTAGYDVEIVSVERIRMTSLPDRLRASYRIRRPASDATVAQVLTSPWAIRIDRIDPAPVAFVQID